MLDYDFEHTQAPISISIEFLRDYLLDMRDSDDFLRDFLLDCTDIRIFRHMMSDMKIKKQLFVAVTKSCVSENICLIKFVYF